jgi:hypothetical protein
MTTSLVGGPFDVYVGILSDDERARHVSARAFSTLAMTPRAPDEDRSEAVVGTTLPLQGGIGPLRRATSTLAL